MKMKASGHGDSQNGPEPKVSEMEDLNGSIQSDEADMIRMGKMQQTKVSATCLGQRSFADTHR
jgi:hypothetical protein